MIKITIYTIKDTDKNYPTRLKETKEHPKTLYVQGDVKLLEKPSIAIVGSRDIDEYGFKQTKRFANYLSQNGITIVSGLARGVDTVAHTFSKDKQGKTIAVIASGFNHIYPEENKKLYQDIIEEGGCVVSEWEEETKIDMHRFPKRNRIISGLSLGTLVIEAKYRSGSQITAHYSMKQGREVFVIPGDIDKNRSIGTNKLIQEGANLVISPKEILDIMEYKEYTLNNKNKVDPKYEEVYKTIGTIPITANEISRIINKRINEVNETLLMLEVEGFIESVGTGKYIKN